MTVEMIHRTLEGQIKDRFYKDKVIIIIGARQVGKTTLVQKILEDDDFLFLDGDESIIRTLLSDTNKKELESIIGDQKIVFIDEAQRIDHIGITAKIIHDQFKDVQLIMSSSSAFELKNKTFEPLTGRKWQYHLYPISYQELEEATHFTEALKDLKTRLVYGFYPDVINHRGDEREILNEIAESYLFKDILAYGPFIGAGFLPAENKNNPSIIFNSPNKMNLADKLLWDKPPSERKKLAEALDKNSVELLEHNSGLFVKALNTLSWYELIELFGAGKLYNMLTDEVINKIFPAKRREYYKNARRLLSEYTLSTAG
jgi:hypothetical protein